MNFMPYNHLKYRFLKDKQTTTTTSTISAICSQIFDF